MAEEIVQMRKSEYDDLIKTSRLNKKKISEEAMKLWKEKGVASLDISVRSERDVYNTIRLDCTAYVGDRYSEFPISYELRKRLSDFLQRQVRYEVDSYYGKPLKVINHYNKMETSLNKWFRLAWLVAVSGWVVAAILMIGG